MNADERQSEWNAMMAESDARESLAGWLQGWEQDYADGQTTISRAEAIRRWEAERKGHEL